MTQEMYENQLERLKKTGELSVNINLDTDTIKKFILYGLTIKIEKPKSVTKE